MSFSVLSTKLILLTAGGALAGAGTGAVIRQAMAPAAPVFVSTALRPAAAASPAAPRSQPGAVQSRLASFQNAGTPSQQIDFALQFAALDSVEEIHALLRQSSHFPPHSASAIAKVILMKRWMELEPAGALAYCRVRASAYLPKLIADFSRERPAEARALVLSLPSGHDRTRAWQELCALALDGPPDQIWAMLGAPPIRDLPHPHTALGGLTSRLVRRNPQDAIARLGTLPSMVLTSTRWALASELTRLDPVAGWAWALQQPSPSELLTASLQTALAADPATAIGLLGSLPPERQWEVYGRYRISWDIKNAAALAQAISGASGISEENKAGMARKFLISSAVDDPAGANALVPLLAPGALEESLKSYLGAWAKSFPPGAVKWIGSLPAGPFRTAAETEWNNRKSGDPGF
jgi:hypothetical protein